MLITPLVPFNGVEGMHFVVVALGALYVIRENVCGKHRVSIESMYCLKMSQTLSVIGPAIQLGFKRRSLSSERQFLTYLYILRATFCRCLEVSS